MKNETVPGIIGFHKVLPPEKLKGDTMSGVINDAVNAARNEAITMCRIHRGRPVALHIIVTSEWLTDSGGAVIETRDVDVGRSRLG